MLLHGTLTIQIIDKFTGVPTQYRPRRSLIMSKKMNNNYYLSVKNSMFPNTIDYNLKDIEKIHSRFIDLGRLTFWFKQPKHQLQLQGDEVQAVKLFLDQIKKMMKGEKVKISGQLMPKAVPAKKKLQNPFDPMSYNHVAIDRFDSRVLNMRNLSKLVLENCKLPSLPVEIGSLPIIHLSLSGSDITSPQCRFDLFWMWMSEDTICNTLTVLKMDAINLTSLPFEMFFLKNLTSLSLANNKLHYLPPIIGELQKLRCLNVSKNMLMYFPYSMYHRVLDELDISDTMTTMSTNPTIFNSIHPNNEHSQDHIYQYKIVNKLTGCTTLQEAQKLYLLSFCALLDNNIKIKREDIPRTLWNLFDVVARCFNCKKFLAPHYGNLMYNITPPEAINLIKSQATPIFAWQSLMCKFGCDPQRKRRHQYV